MQLRFQYSTREPDDHHHVDSQPAIIVGVVSHFQQERSRVY